jgi:hypothetical protein
MWPLQLAVPLFIVCRIFLSSFTIRSTSSLPTRLVQLIFSIPLQQHISKLPRYLPQCLSFSTTQRQLCSKCNILLVSSLMWGQYAGERSAVLVECCFCHGRQYLHIKTLNQPQIPAMLSHPHAVYGYFKGRYTLVTLPRIVTPYRYSVDETRARVTYQKLVTR